MIVIVTNRKDHTADFLILELQRLDIPYFRLNTEDFPDKISVDWTLTKSGIEGYFYSKTKGIRVDFDDIAGVWYRRPTRCKDNPLLGQAGNRFRSLEAWVTLEGVWKTLRCNIVSDPDQIRRAENKLLQLVTAKNLGFLVPDTIVTTTPALAGAFCKGRDVVTKVLCQGRIETEEAQCSTIFTTKLTSTDIEALDNVAYCPTLLQEYVPKRVELRVTVIGKHTFAVELDSQKNSLTRDDWRRGQDRLFHKVHDLDPSVQTQCQELVRSLGLRFGAIDLVLRPDRKHVFLEINPNGQWAWMEQLLGLPMRKALIETLLEG